MKGSVVAVGRAGIVAGLRLAGLDPIEADFATAAAALENLASSPDVGVVLIEEALWERLPSEQRRRLDEEPLPLVIPFPSPGLEPPEERAEVYLVEMLRQAVGYRVKLR